jgi:FMN phosphatase YigB (HAD superfamily)
MTIRPASDWIDCARVLSLDVFDTILCRTWLRPRDVFRVLARRLRAAGLTDADEEEIAAVRHALERELRAAAASGETTLAAVHAGIAARLGYSPETAAEAQRLELEIEHASVGLIGSTAEIARCAGEAGIRHVYASDSYLPESAIHSLLARAGAPEGAVFVSSETGASKRNGRLFAEIGAVHRTSHIHHVGDHHGADVKGATNAGWTADHFQEQQPNRYERALAEAAWSDPLAGSAVAGAARAARLTAPAGDGGWPAVQAIGADVAGPMFTAFAAWCLTRAEARGLECLLFLARDGQVFARIATEIAPALSTPAAVRYAYASRQALYLPAVHEPGDLAWSWLEERLEGQRVSAALARFGLPPDALGLPPDTVIAASQAAAVRVALRSPELAPRVLAAAAARRAAACAYFRGEVGDARRIGFVDIGWKGRLQLCVERIFAADPVLAEVTVHGLYLSLVPSAAILAEARAEAFAPYAAVANPVMAEILASADHGTLRGYEPDGAGGARPLFEPQDARALAWGVQALQAGAVAFARTLVRNADLGMIPLPPLLAELAAPALAGFRAFADRPTAEEARVLGDIPHSDDSAHQGEAPLAPDLGPGGALRLAIPGAAPGGGRAPFWAAGSIARSAGGHVQVARGLQTALAAGNAGLRVRRRLGRWLKTRLRAVR